MKNNKNQVCWLLEKAERADAEQQHQGGFATFQEFLDNQQYTRRGILRYEKMFGAGYVSTGGPSTTKVRLGRCRDWGGVGHQVESTYGVHTRWRHTPY